MSPTQPDWTGKRKSVVAVGVVLAVGGAALLGLGLFYRSLTVPLIQLPTGLALASGIALVFFAVSRAYKRSNGETATLCLAAAAIIFAVWQFVDSRSQEAKMTELAQSMSTRFVGFFPKNMRDINEVVSHADKTVDIMTDYVGYGHFSAPQEFERYLRTLEDLRARGVQVRMIIYSYEQAAKRQDEQFKDDEFREMIGISATAKSENHTHTPSDKLIAFCKKFNLDFCKLFNEQQSAGKKRDVSVLKKAAFNDLLFHKQVDYMEALFDRGVEIKETTKDHQEEPLPFFFWCEDNHEAVFSFLNEEPDLQPKKSKKDKTPPKVPREVSFRTRDSKLVVDTFELRFQEIWDDPSSQEVHRVEMKKGRRLSWDRRPSLSTPSPK